VRWTSELAHLAVSVNRLLQARLKRRQLGVGVVEGVEAEAQDVDIACVELAGEIDAIHKPAHAAPVPSVRKVQHDLDVVAIGGGPNTLSSRVEQLREIVEVVVVTSRGPEYTSIDFVANLRVCRRRGIDTTVDQERCSGHDA